MYFPGAKNAKLKDPQSLSLQIAFNGPHFANNKALVPFTRKLDYWEALVSLSKFHAAYAIFSIKDEETNAVDDNGGKYWDVVFCNANGDKSAVGFRSQAESYTGELWPYGIHREKDYARAVSILEKAHATSPYWDSMLWMRIWEYKAKREGETRETYAKLATEIERQLDEHSGNRTVQYGVGNFVVRHEKKFPVGFVERIVARLDEEMKEPTYSFRAELALQRANSEPDARKRVAAIDQVIATFPGYVQVQFAHFSRFQTCVQLKNVMCAETSFAKYRELREHDKDVGNPYLDPWEFLVLANLYIEKGVKLESALNLADEAAGSIQSLRASFDDEFARSIEADIAETRARGYIALQKYDLAVPQAEQAVAGHKNNAEAHFVLAQAYSGAGEKQKALDEYFEAALMPSNKDLEYRAELERYYRKNFGNAKQYEAVLNKRIADRFRAANYIPKLLDQSAPAFEFTTLKGEKYDTSALNGKTVIINFWSPG